MQASLVEIVSRVRGASDSIATGAEQIAVGGTELSQRTEEQASALEETAATMEEFTGSARRSTEARATPMSWQRRRPPSPAGVGTRCPQW